MINVVYLTLVLAFRSGVPDAGAQISRDHLVRLIQPGPPMAMIVYSIKSASIKRRIILNRYAFGEGLFNGFCGALSPDKERIAVRLGPEGDNPIPLRIAIFNARNGAFEHFIEPPRLPASEVSRGNKIYLEWFGWHEKQFVVAYYKDSPNWIRSKLHIVCGRSEGTWSEQAVFSWPTWLEDRLSAYRQKFLAGASWLARNNVDPIFGPEQTGAVEENVFGNDGGGRRGSVRGNVIAALDTRSNPPQLVVSRGFGDPIRVTLQIRPSLVVVAPDDLVLVSGIWPDPGEYLWLNDKPVVGKLPPGYLVAD